ncbi:hypothetical protein EJ04DRAFT_151884 [Polyplosphaeria fusca]|uniref:Uncharacterized protein n=1 Tax=Polyplosphaeria fusca TaxID=682080 RepID=A0A9P4QIH2_9PLEO|nr:hypothetical protein EJ04DRAFT_151884 [Polyplosphaeria fusca]
MTAADTTIRACENLGDIAKALGLLRTGIRGPSRFDDALASKLNASIQKQATQIALDVPKPELRNYLTDQKLDATDPGLLISQFGQIWKHDRSHLNPNRHEHEDLYPYELYIDDEKDCAKIKQLLHQWIILSALMKHGPSTTTDKIDTSAQGTPASPIQVKITARMTNSGTTHSKSEDEGMEASSASDSSDSDSDGPYLTYEQKFLDDVLATGGKRRRVNDTLQQFHKPARKTARRSTTRTRTSEGTPDDGPTAKDKNEVGPTQDSVAGSMDRDSRSQSRRDRSIFSPSRTATTSYSVSDKSPKMAAPLASSRTTPLRPLHIVTSPIEKKPDPRTLSYEAQRQYPNESTDSNDIVALPIGNNMGWSTMKSPTALRDNHILRNEISKRLREILRGDSPEMIVFDELVAIIMASEKDIEKELQQRFQFRFAELKLAFLHWKTLHTCLKKFWAANEFTGKSQEEWEAHKASWGPYGDKQERMLEAWEELKHCVVIRKANNRWVPDDVFPSRLAEYFIGLIQGPFQAKDLEGGFANYNRALLKWFK